LTLTPHPEGFFIDVPAFDHFIASTPLKDLPAALIGGYAKMQTYYFHMALDNEPPIELLKSTFTVWDFIHEALASSPEEQPVSSIQPYVCIYGKATAKSHSANFKLAVSNLLINSELRPNALDSLFYPRHVIYFPAQLALRAFRAVRAEQSKAKDLTCDS
jgi:hypothetical protein